MVPLSDVIFPPHGTEGGKGKGERKEECIYKYIYISETGIQQGGFIIQQQSVKKGDFSSPSSSTFLLSVSPPLSFTLRRVPRRLSVLKISQ